MAKRRKVSIKKAQVRKPTTRQATVALRNPFKWAESYTSLLMGIVVVIVAVLFVVSFIKQTRHIQQTSSISTTATPIPVNVIQDSLKKTNQQQQTYTVQPGDDLWHIAETYYKSGYNWVDIAQANHLNNPGILYAGTQLVIPQVAPKVTTVTQAQSLTPVQNAILASTYTVQSGDNLWTIAQRAYNGNGYKWVDIAKANNLANPNLIFSGNVLTIPR